MNLKRNGFVNGLAIAAISLGFISLPASADLVISEIDLLNNQVELVNTGAIDVDASTWWWCNRVNGAPFYAQMSTSTIDTNLSTATSLNVGVGEILVLNVAPGILPDVNGELGIYNTNSFGSSGAIEDYVLWGANGIRDIVAQNAGIWIDNDSIDVSGMGAGTSVQLGFSNPGDVASEYFVGTSSLGIAQSVPEPSTLALTVLAGLAAFLFRRRI